jgi:metallo-beta-lactamase family protein
MAINREHGVTILAASGMCHAGRILHHLEHNLWRSCAHVVIVGFQARGSLGRALVDGAERVRLMGEEIAVRARLHTLGGFSAHADHEGLLEWLDGLGEPRAGTDSRLLGED